MISNIDNNYIDYTTQLLDNKWLKKRLKILNRDSNRCTECNSTGSLQVHHLYYIKGRNAWDYPDNALLTLCNKCHKDWHKKYNIEVRAGAAKHPFKPTLKKLAKRNKQNSNVLPKALLNYNIPKNNISMIVGFLKSIKWQDRPKYIKYLQSYYGLKK